MYLFLVTVHVILSLMLVLIIILQPGKGGDVGAAFGGAGGSTIFGPRGPTSVLQQVTTGVAVGFMVTSISLAWYSNKSLLAGGSDVLDEIEAVTKEKRAEEAAKTTPAPVEELLEEAPLEVELEEPVVPAEDDAAE
ncbi:MAG: preprotein translocase subunit SecG [Alphaproteobacteria bacterium]|nr:preprotein translocase subunit SecG [Alphaproteobacteria bacterium]